MAWVKNTPPSQGLSLSQLKLLLLGYVIESVSPHKEAQRNNGRGSNLNKHHQRNRAPAPPPHNSHQPHCPGVKPTVSQLGRLRTSHLTNCRGCYCLDGPGHVMESKGRAFWDCTRFIMRMFREYMAIKSASCT